MSNPYRGTSPPSGTLTATAYDAMGRAVSVANPDSTSSTTSYAGLSTTVTDAGGHSRLLTSDILGRMVAVTEDPGGANYSTSYSYDYLNNLLSVSPGSQTRSFTYDSLSRLTSGTNPESGLPVVQ